MNQLHENDILTHIYSVLLCKHTGLTGKANSCPITTQLHDVGQITCFLTFKLSVI